MSEQIKRALKELERMRKYYSPERLPIFPWLFNRIEYEAFVMAQKALQEQLDTLEGCEYCHNCCDCCYSTEDKNCEPCLSCKVKGTTLTHFSPRKYYSNCSNCGRKLKE